jgi:hypothetical protein
LSLTSILIVAEQAEVARIVRLSPSRISAMFKGQTFPTKKFQSNGDGIDSDCWDEDEDHHVPSGPI